MRHITKNNTLVQTTNGTTTVRLHHTTVVSFDQDRVTLNSGGWRTVTTKARMNQAANQFALPYRVWQKDFSWFITIGDKVYTFHDYMSINRNDLTVHDPYNMIMRAIG